MDVISGRKKRADSRKKSIPTNPVILNTITGSNGGGGKNRWAGQNHLIDNNSALPDSLSLSFCRADEGASSLGSLPRNDVYLLNE